MKPSSKAGPAPRRLLAGAVSIAAHVLVTNAALLWLRMTPSPPAAEPEIATVMVNEAPDPKPPGPPDAAASAAAVPLEIVAPPVPPVTAPSITIQRAAMPADTSDLLSESQIAGAARADEGGGGGGGCDMARAVQQVLRREPRVRSAVAEADRLGKSSMLWNGDWVRTGGQEGKGLAVVRQAIIWEVGFAPEACRNARMRGMVLLSLADGSTRFAIGAGEWRWSDLLGLRSAAVR
jgi:hypothetical protein